MEIPSKQTTRNRKKGKKMNTIDDFVKIKLTYKDDKEVNINLLEDNLELFLNHLHANKIFWGKEKGMPDKGFWTNIEDIRLYEIETIKGQENEGKKRTINKSPTEISGVKDKARERNSTAKK